MTTFKSKRPFIIVLHIKSHHCCTTHSHCWKQLFLSYQGHTAHYLPKWWICLKLSNQDCPVSPGKCVDSQVLLQRCTIFWNVRNVQNTTLTDALPGNCSETCRASQSLSVECNVCFCCFRGASKAHVRAETAQFVSVFLLKVHGYEITFSFPENGIN